MSIELRIALAVQRARALWGKEFHMRLLQEECAELIAAVNQFDRGRCSIEKVAEEVADVGLMIVAARGICGEALVEGLVIKKLERLEQRIKEDSEKHDALLRRLT